MVIGATLSYIVISLALLLNYLWLFDEVLAWLFKKEKYTLSVEYLNESKTSREILGLPLEHDIVSYTPLRYRYMTRIAATYNMMLLNTVNYLWLKFSKEEPMFIYKVKELNYVK